MDHRHPASPRPRALVVAVAALLAWASIASVASAAPNKKTFTTSAGAIVAGHTYSPASPVVVTITNTSSSTELGSANVTIPTGVSASSVSSSVGSASLAGTIIELRDLGLTPGQSVTASVAAEVECGSVHAPYTWSTAAKQSNDFNGTGNDLTGASPSSTFIGSCGLVFTKQPRHAEKSPVVITNAIYNPAGDPVTVTVLDGVGVQTVTWWSGEVDLQIEDDPSAGVAALSGVITGSPVGGVVTFAPSIDLSATGYSLEATATPTARTPSVGTSSAGFESDNFNIVDDATICEASVGCSAEAGVGQKTSAKVDASATGGAAGDLVILSINDPTVSVNCGGYNETSDVVVFDVTDATGAGGSNRTKIATLTLLAEFVTKSASKYQVCYDNGVENPFLLPTCANKDPQPPCLISKSLDKDKNLVIVIFAPAGDPAVKF